MYKNHCCCGAITLEVHADIDATDASTQSLAECASTNIRMLARDEDIVVDAEPSALGCLEIFPGHRQFFCNICANTLYSRFENGQVSLQVQFSGHDLTAQHHVDQCRV